MAFIVALLNFLISAVENLALYLMGLSQNQLIYLYAVIFGAGLFSLSYLLGLKVIEMMLRYLDEEKEIEDTPTPKKIGDRRDIMAILDLSHKQF